MKKQTIAAIAKTLKQLSANSNNYSQYQRKWLTDLKQDSRKGVQMALQQLARRQKHFQQQREAFMERLKYEHELWHINQQVAGVDEVGRGPLAGPVVAACVMIGPDFDLLEVNDSKQLTKHQRAQLYPKILQKAKAVGIGVVDNNLIDQINIYEASRLAMKQAVNATRLTADTSNLAEIDHLLVDAMQIDVLIAQTKLIKGDTHSVSIAAASIVAKVYRDRLMEFYAQCYPQYAWEQNDGYGTKAHLEAMQQYGITPLHRKSFSPVKKYC